MPEPLLQAVNLSKRYRDLVAVDGLDLAVRAGECYGLLGPNGAGKTTTVEMLEGISTPSGGEVRFRGEPLRRDYAQVIGIQFQHTALQEYLTARETLRLFQGLYPRALPVDRLSELCALGSFLDRDTRKLSGGQRQRLLLAIALVNDPVLLFLDEPTTGLDPQARHAFWRLVEGIKAAGKTVLLTTHYMEEAERLCDRVAIMDHGRILVEDTPARLLRQHFDGVLVRLPESALPAGLPFAHERRHGQLEFQASEPEAALRRLLDHGVPLDGLYIHHPTLEDLFLKLTGHALRS
ncbi:MAG TPA: ABC transporter ATP-binding protein [Gammaproteobacteria bacterium]